ncbi:Hsp70 family protein [Novosphingobium sp. Leaf2]|uniref:Hsp70 family protein n=1 Tax=Novosphingobium sp. Leaf2 TaxID=1735670 RepID=UPI0006FA5693|nr:Hsp70 family protein [Novosphingobium sp. Leaf2]KQM18686.1 molecular chaperone Hsp70 [Novosphingobium sp. Leaf2]
MTPGASPPPAHIGSASIRSAGIDFGTTNSVVALGDGDGAARMVDFAAPDGTGSVFRSALCFWQDDGPRGALAHEAGPWAIAEFLDFPQGSRFLQSFKSVAANPLFESAPLFERRMRFEELGQVFLRHLIGHGGEALANLPERIVVGRPVRYVGARPDPALARTRYDAMFALLEREVHYVYEPIGAAYSFAARLTEPATLLVADFGGGTSDFSVVRVAAPGSTPRCTPLGSAGVGIAGDRFDFRIMDKLVLPMLGKGGTYRSFDKVLEIPDGHFADFADWSRLALLRNRRTLEELARLQRAATDTAAIGRMIAVVENELGYPLYDAVGGLKRALSQDEVATFRFDSADLSIAAEVTRADFESWIAPDLARIAQTVDLALARAGLGAEAIDHVFLTGGSSLIPAVRALFTRRFGDARIDSGGELTSIAHGLALIGQEDNLAAWTVEDEMA